MKYKHILTILIGIFLIANTSAFAISSKYWDDNPASIAPGETKEITIILQNLAGDSDLLVEGRITSNRDIANVVAFEKEYSVQAGEKTSITLLVTIPEKNFKERYVLTTSFKTKSANEGGFSLGAGIEKSIPIVVMTEQTEESKLKISYFVIALLILIIAGLITFRIKRKKKKANIFVRKLK